MGPYPVGVMTYEGIYDTSRTDQWGNPRHLVTEVWYPATEAARGQPGKAYDLEDLMTDQERTEVQQAGITIPLDQTVAVENAAPRLEGGPYPLIAFSHGQAGMRWQSTYYTVQLASHGYVVIAPDHPGDTLQDAFDLGADPPLLDSFFARELDIAFLISYFTCIDEPTLVTDFVCIGADDMMWGMTPTHAATAEIGVTGHSYGALTSLRAGILDSRVKAIVPQAPTNAVEALFDLGGTAAVIKTPSLIEGAGKDQTLPFCENADEAYTQTSQPRALVNLVNGGHFTFSDLCQFNLGSVVDQLGFINVAGVIEDGCGTAAPVASVAEPIINNYAIGFFNWQLRGSAGTLTKYLTQAAGDALAPDWQVSCTPDTTCNAGTGCCLADQTATPTWCCVQEYSTNTRAGQSTCAQGQSCSPTRNVCEVVEVTSNF